VRLNWLTEQGLQPQTGQWKDNMDFIKDLSEARLTRDAQDQKSLTYSDCCEKFYLILLTLEMMRQFPTSTNFVRQYCKDSHNQNYRNFKISGTDLYNLIYFIEGDEHALGKLMNPDAAKRAQDSVAFPLHDVGRYLQRVATGNAPVLTQQLFIRIENGLYITNRDYKDIRRYLSTFDKISNRERKQVITKLLYALRSKLRNSDIIDDFSKLVAQRDLESEWVKDTEPTSNIIDVGTTGRDLINYRLLLDNPKNVFLIKLFVQAVKDGRSIPANQAQAYSQIVQMVDDIVQAGPAYVSMLKTIHKKAKKAK